ncbi:hypothetical protein [Kitasatospora sp. NPDC058218]|uniref:hypothetical protein n=1 Tax=Kitasatospora sp. NPDC058218 TaxID=3346385 RepID=UPI0036DDBA19
MPEIDGYADDETELVINTVDGPQEGETLADDGQDVAGQGLAVEAKTRGSVMGEGQM